MAITNPSRRMKDHTASFIIHIGNGFICGTVRTDKLACPYGFIHENDLSEWIINQCQKHLEEEVSSDYKFFKVRIIMDVEPSTTTEFHDYQRKQKEDWEKLTSKGKGRVPNWKDLHMVI